MSTLSLNLEELWVVQQLVRDSQDLGAEWDKDDMKMVHAAILFLQGKDAFTTIDIECSDGLLWQMENQIPQTLDLGRTNRGRDILLKVFAAIQVTEEETYEEPIPDVFRRSFGDADPCEDDPSADDNAAEESSAGCDLSRSTADTPG